MDKKQLSKESYFTIIGVGVLIITILRIIIFHHPTAGTQPLALPSTVNQQTTESSPKPQIKSESSTTENKQPSDPIFSSSPQPSNPNNSISSKLDSPAITPPKVALSGSVTPAIAQKGSKIVISINVENQDTEKTVDGVRILFSNSDFLQKGLTIVNVMSGGSQDGRAFVWKNDFMKIPPGEKRSFQIVAYANLPGSYQSTINVFQSNSTYFSYANDNDELLAKLAVIN